MAFTTSTFSCLILLSFNVKFLSGYEYITNTKRLYDNSQTNNGNTQQPHVFSAISSNEKVLSDSVTSTRQVI